MNESKHNGVDHSHQPEGGDEEFSIAKSKALAPMLILAALTVLAILVAIVRTKPVTFHEGAVADTAFSPADFPVLFGKGAKVPGLEPADSMVAHGASDSKVMFPVPPPPFSDGIFPCSDCHASMDTDATQRELSAMHDDIDFRHDQENRWCLDCHDADNRDQLRLASGAPVPFTESYRLCGQCHGTQYRDWRNGIHGKRTGYWNGSKRYLLCVNCHNPHNPRFPAVAPLPPPVRPQYLRHAAQDVERDEHRQESNHGDGPG